MGIQKDLQLKSVPFIYGLGCFSMKEGTDFCCKIGFEMTYICLAIFVPLNDNHALITQVKGHFIALFSNGYPAGSRRFIRRCYHM